MKQKIALFVTILMLILLIPFSALAGDGTISSSGTYDISSYGDNSTITINIFSTERYVTLTNTSGATYSNLKIDCKDAGTKLTLDGVKIVNTAGCALAFNGQGNILTLVGKSELTSGYHQPGIRVEDDYPEICSLTITGSGEIEVFGGDRAAGIGASYDGVSGTSYQCGSIEINSGKVTATGGSCGAGIGGGDNGLASEMIEINGGEVIANGGYQGAGIGSGSQSAGSYGGWIYINDGKVTATGGDFAAGIGGGSSGNCGYIAIRNGTVKATGGGSDGGGVSSPVPGGAGIGGGAFAFGSTQESGGWIIIYNGDVEAIGGTRGAGIGTGYKGPDLVGPITIHDGNVKATGGENGAGIGGGYLGAGGTIELEGGIIAAEKHSWADYDIGDEIGGTTLSISETAAVFLKNDAIVTPSTSHTHYVISDISDGGIIGVPYPTGWSPSFGAYLKPVSLSYSANGGTGTVADTQTKHAELTATIEDGSHITRDRYDNGGWTTNADGTGTTYAAGTSVTITSDLDLFIKWNEIPVTGVSLSSSIATILDNETFTLTADVDPDNATHPEVAWTTSDTDVVTVDNGVVTGVGPGCAVITATAGGMSDTCKVTVNPSQDGTYDIGKYGNDAFIALLDNLNITFTNTSGTALSNTQIICGTGIDLALNNVKIDASAKPYQCALVFSGGSTPSEHNTLTLIGESILESGENEAGVRVEENTYLTIKGNGKLIAKGGNNAAGIGGGNGWNCGHISIEGGEICADGDSLNGAMDIGYAGGGSGGTLSISATAAVFLKNDESLTPTTSHTHYVINDTSSGGILGVDYPAGWAATFGAYLNPVTLSYDTNEGTGSAPASQVQHAGTSFTVADGRGITKWQYVYGGWNTLASGAGDSYDASDNIMISEDTTIFVEWDEVRVTSVTLSSNAETMTHDDTLTLTATVAPGDARYPEVTWSSSNTEAATVDQSGLVTAVGIGEATITATADGVSDTCVVTVEEIYTEEVIDGKLNRTYYKEDGSIDRVVIYYGEDDSIGIWKINYYEDGVKTSYEEYNESGVLAKRVYLYSSGKQKRRELYTDTGVWYSISEYYTNGKLCKKKYMHSNGKLRLCEFYSSSTGNKYAFSEYDTNGKIEKKTYLYSSGIRKKVEFYSTSTGNKYAVSEYRTNGKLEKKTYLYSSGVRKKIYYYSSTTGNKYAVSDYRTNGKLEKKTYLYSNGVRKKIYYYSSTTGNKYAVSEYRTNGSLAKKTYLYSNGVRKKIDYYSATSGKIYAISEYNTSGKLEKKTYLYSSGVKKRVDYYSTTKGYKIAARFYDTNGDMTRKEYYNSDGSVREAIYYGTGDSVLSDINLTSKFYTAQISHTGSKNFIVEDYLGSEWDLLVNHIGNYNGTVLVKDIGTHSMNITADGNWSVSISPITSTTDLSFSGEGDFVTPCFTMPSNKTWSFTHDGSSNFIVEVYSWDDWDLAVNKIGSYTGSQIVDMTAGEKTFFVITADGNWTLTH